MCLCKVWKKLRRWLQLVTFSRFVRVNVCPFYIRDSLCIMNTLRIFLFNKYKHRPDLSARRRVRQGERWRGARMAGSERIEISSIRNISYTSYTSYISTDSVYKFQYWIHITITARALPVSCSFIFHSLWIYFYKFRVALAFFCCLAQFHSLIAPLPPAFVNRARVFNFVCCFPPVNTFSSEPLLTRGKLQILP